MKILIYGLGLIGGSLGKSLKSNKQNIQICGYDVDENTLQYAIDNHIVDEIIDLESSIEDIDIVFIASPLKSYENIFKWLRNKKTKSDIIITDLGSVKSKAHKLFESIFQNERTFIGGHPMAGSDKSGIKNSTGSLFENAVYFLTNPNIHIKDLEFQYEKLESIIKLTKAKILRIDSQKHDKIVSKVSHIPHIMASILVNSVDDNECIDYVGTGFKDTTRIASGNPELWTDIIMSNSHEIVENIDVLIDGLQNMKSNIQRKKEDQIQYELDKSKKLRAEIPKHLKDNISPLYDIIIDVKDRPGVLGEVTTLLGIVNVNIKQIEILNSREGYHGALRLCFEDIENLNKGVKALEFADFKFDIC